MDTWKTLEDFDLVTYEIELRGGEDGKWVSLQTLHSFWGTFKRAACCVTTAAGRPVRIFAVAADGVDSHFDAVVQARGGELLII